MLLAIDTRYKKYHLKRYLSLILTVLLVARVFNLEAQKKITDSTSILSELSPKIEISGEYLVPTRFSNKIKTVNLNAFYWKKYFKNASIIIGAGFTTTYAWGHSIQEEPLNDSVVLLYEYQTSAFGLGPVLQVDPTIIKIGKFSVTAEATGGLMFYNRPFPYGGDYYNFMFRTGPSIIYRFKNNFEMKLGYRWMHVSNGKGYGNQNPFYEAQGFNIGIVFF